ncbi:hypothetical protein PHSY_004772 [Pseudozyma hubeiensis SY62]|uniref:RRN7-type domain-containing protein n=1 Tax=Pseudozyma hubeiensis (strain SY62) TaxID=1305764 RepID=R9P7F6_PSEHS|nr:hypothetical protein PHSY_004772 [Pseudozyma hubeiensis SY62]GAC97187.1 hypothetical protein PHSY_004772 [Pseudozyma hubeiensis SY62]
MLPYSSQYDGRYGQSHSQPNSAPASDFDNLFSSQPGSSMASHQHASQSSQRPRCPECGTKKMRLRSGQLICKRGHVQQHFRIEQAEDDEFLGDGVARKRRTVTVNKVRRLKSQHTPYYSQPETDVEQEDSEGELIEQESRRAHKRARRQSSRSRHSSHSDDADAIVSDDEVDKAQDDPPYSIRADSFFERDPWTPRSRAVSSAAEESDLDSEPDTYARASRRGIRRIWRSGVGLHGAYEGRFALLQCLQLTLRLQLHKLREIWADKMPPETEAIARDLWTMFVSLLPVGHYPPEPLIAATFDWHMRYSLSQERAAELFPNHDTYDPETDIRHHRRRALFNGYHHHVARKQRPTATPSPATERTEQEEEEHFDSDDPAAAKDCIDWIVGQDEQQRRFRSQRSSEPESLADPEDELAELDPVFAEERRQRQRSQAVSEAGSDTEAPQSHVDPSGRPEKHPRRHRHIPSWANKHSVAKAQAQILHLAMVPTTISIIYLSLHLLKIPVFWTDLIKLISSHRLPYLNVVHSLPLPLTRFLNKDNVHHHHLDADVVPSITTLHLHTLNVADLLQRTYGLNFGQGNVSGQLARLVENMLLPPTFYVATKRLLDKIDRGVGPDLLPGLSLKDRGLPQQGNKDKEESPSSLPGATQLQRVPKEFVLMAALLMVIKMRYGLDGRSRDERIPESSSDGSAGRNRSGGLSCAPLLQPWLSALDRRRQRYLESLEAAIEMDPSELEALHMTSEQVEAYAAFAEENLILSNHIDLHEWRRLEPQRQWAAFTEFIPDTASPKPSNLPVQASRPDGSHALEAPQPNWADLESDLRSLYRHNTAPPTSATSALEPGTAYPMHQFLSTSRPDSDPLGLTYSSVYPRVIRHANDLVGIATPQSASVAMDVMISQMVNPRAESADASVKMWESAFGIEAHLEVVERMVEAELRGRAAKMRRSLRKVQQTEDGGGLGPEDDAAERIADSEEAGDDERSSVSSSDETEDEDETSSE